MHSRYAHPLLVMLALAAYGLSLGGAPNVMVVCFGNDGHVALESPARPCSDSDSAAPNPVDASLSATCVSSAACVDVPLGAQSDTSTARRAVPRAVATAGLTTPTMIAALGALAPAPLPLSLVRDRAHGADQSGLHSIVLLV